MFEGKWDNSHTSDTILNGQFTNWENMKKTVKIFILFGPEKTVDVYSKGTTQQNQKAISMKIL